MTSWLGRLRGRSSLARCVSNGETRGPHCDIGPRRRELIEVDRGVGRDLGASPRERGRRCGINRGYGSQVDHVEVASRHELNVHHFPDASSVCGPANRALCTFIVDITWPR